MIPLRDNIPPSTVPVVNYLLLGLTTLVFVAQLGEGTEGNLVERYGLIPARVMHPERVITVPEIVERDTPFGPQIVTTEHEAAPPALPVWLTLLSCIFLHGGWLHFLGNMWFLHIFGDNVEDRFGHVGYLLFYLFTGVAASAAHLFANVSSEMPTIGASGAIAGVMGAYFYLYPHAKVTTILPIFIFIQIIVLPAQVFLGIWFFLQFSQGTFSVTGTATGGVAWWAHIGGFVAGLVIAFFLSDRGRLRPRVEVIRPNTDRVSIYRFGSGPR